MPIFRIIQALLSTNNVLLNKMQHIHKIVKIELRIDSRMKVNEKSRD